MRERLIAKAENMAKEPINGWMVLFTKDILTKISGKGLDYLNGQMVNLTKETTLQTRELERDYIIGRMVPFTRVLSLMAKDTVTELSLPKMEPSIGAYGLTTRCMAKENLSVQMAHYLLEFGKRENSWIALCHCLLHLQNLI
mgnify:CR=1 FL=1